MDYTKLFYWLVVADNAISFFNAFKWLFTIIATMATLVYIFTLDGHEGEAKRYVAKWIWWSYPFMILFWALFIFTPSKKDALLIVAGGSTLNFLTTDSTAKRIPHELTSFVVTELKNMAKDAEVDLGVLSQKDKIIEEAKNMTANELMDKMKTDTTFAKIILNK